MNQDRNDSSGKQKSNSGYIQKVEQTGFLDRLDVGYGRKKAVKQVVKVLTQTGGRRGLPLSEMKLVCIEKSRSVL